MSDEAPRPTVKQLDYIKRLSRSRGVSFGRPRTRAAASQQIAALKAMSGRRVERRRERDLDRLITPLGDAAAVREGEVEGYGSSCRWRGSPRTA